MEDDRRPVRTQQSPTAASAATDPLPEPPELPEPEADEPDDEVVPDGRYEPL